MVRPVVRILPGPAVAAALILSTFAIARAQQPPAGEIRLPEARRQGAMSVEAALWARRSVRTFTRDPISLADAAQLLWAAQGANRPDGHRTAPSAGATYPLEVYVVAARVQDLPPGVYRYRSGTHTLEPTSAGDHLGDLVAATRQAWIGDAAVVIVFGAVYERTSRRYGERAERYVPIEVGHAGQNVCLQAVALGLGTTVVGAAADTAVARVVGLPSDVRFVDMIPVGRPR